ncbi:hypothetical protein BD626DRAFT_35542 [Schizophyllum amplum]|uniref:Uncharacterized protein n=1 Tax=Schizophyllum amplum TaxID=97359 RepID=A0A550CEL8_9AGAR|nr:hypothetical protein BD626DRAFT_35542 [Auriculariopsis ampla]
MVIMCVSCLLYGVLTALFIASIPILSRKQGRATILKASVITLFVSSSIAWAMSTMRIMRNMADMGDNCYHRHSKRPTKDPKIPPLVVASIANGFLISDALVVWRAWMLWPHSRVARGALSFCIACTIVATLLDEIFQDLPTRHQSIFGPLLHNRSRRRSVAAAARVRIRISCSLGWQYCCEFSKNTTRHCRRVHGFRTCDLPACGCGIYPTFLVVAVTAQQRTTAESVIRGQDGLLTPIRFSLSRHHFGHGSLRVACPRILAGEKYKCILACSWRDCQSISRKASWCVFRRSFAARCQTHYRNYSAAKPH